MQEDGVGSSPVQRAQTPEAILCDYLSMFVGDDHAPDYWTPAAKTMLTWLAEEGWQLCSSSEHQADSTAADGDVAEDVGANGRVAGSEPQASARYLHRDLGGYERK